jgi:small GTP-binding protein
MEPSDTLMKPLLAAPSGPSFAGVYTSHPSTTSLPSSPLEGHQQQEDSVKVVMLGDSGVGKSSIAMRFTKDQFDPHSTATVGAALMTRSMEIPLLEEQNDRRCDNGSRNSNPQEDEDVLHSHNQRVVEFKIWDTAGQEKYASLVPMYYRAAAAAIIVYDLTRKASFAVLQRWVTELQTKGPDGIVLAICGNKLDLEATREVSEAEAQSYADIIGAFYVEVSARDDKNINALFTEVAKRVPAENGEELTRRAESLRLQKPKTYRYLGGCCMST